MKNKNIIVLNKFVSYIQVIENGSDQELISQIIFNSVKVGGDVVSIVKNKCLNLSKLLKVGNEIDCNVNDNNFKCVVVSIDKSEITLKALDYYEEDKIEVYELFFKYYKNDFIIIDKDRTHNSIKDVIYDNDLLINDFTIENIKLNKCKKSIFNKKLIELLDYKEYVHASSILTKNKKLRFKVEKIEDGYKLTIDYTKKQIKDVIECVNNSHIKSVVSSLYEDDLVDLTFKDYAIKFYNEEMLKNIFNSKSVNLKKFLLEDYDLRCNMIGS